MNFPTLLFRLCLVFQVSLFCVLSTQVAASAQDVVMDGKLLEHATTKWLIKKLDEGTAKIKKEGRHKSDVQADKDELCIDVSKELDKRLADDRLEALAEEILRRHFLRKTYGVIDDACWCRLYKKWCIEGKVSSRDLDNIAKRICPHLFPKKPEGEEDDPKPTPTPTPIPTPRPSPKDGPKGGVKGGYCPKGLKLINDCVRGDGISIFITGDGSATSHSKLTLRDTKSGRQSSVELETICMSPKTKRPPPTEEVAEMKSIHYRLGPAAPPFVAQTLNAADALDEQGKYANVPIAAARRKATVAQLAIWQHFGGTGQGKDAINRRNVKEDMLKKAGIKKSELSRSEDKRLTDKVDLICEAVDLTCKTTETTTTERPKRKEEKPGIPVPENPPGKPVDDGRTTEKPGHPEDGGTTEKPGHPEGGGGDEPRHPGENIVCIPELTTFECDNPEYQTMCTVEDAVVECPVITIGDGGYDGTPLPVKGPPCEWKLYAVNYGPQTGRAMPAEGTRREELEAAARALVNHQPTIKSERNLVTDPPPEQGNPDVWLTFVCVEPNGNVKHAAVERVPLIDLKERWVNRTGNWGQGGQIEKRLNSVRDTLKAMRGI